MRSSLGGLVLTGGGARGAYQAGVLKRVAELKSVQTHGNPFPIISGASAGAINAALMAIGSDDFPSAARFGAGLWSRLTPADVFRCDLGTHALTSLTWILDLSLGRIVGGGNARSLLDPAPLRDFLHRQLRCGRIRTNIEREHLYALAISAFNYNSGMSCVFIQGKTDHPLWDGSRRVTIAKRITVEDVCASAAIPFIFPPVKLRIGRKEALFGDGCLRLQRPLSPAIRLGADRILAIGVTGNTAGSKEDAPAGEGSLAQLAGVLFGVTLLDNLTVDHEHLERLNQMIESCDRKERSGGEGIRPVRSILITPSVDLSEVAEEHQRHMPYFIRNFVNSLGRDSASTSELMSYLLFKPSYTNALIDIGYNDADSRIDEIEHLLYSPVPERKAAPAISLPAQAPPVGGPFAWLRARFRQGAGIGAAATRKAA